MMNILVTDSYVETCPVLSPDLAQSLLGSSPASHYPDENKRYGIWMDNYVKEENIIVGVF